MAGMEMYCHIEEIFIASLLQVFQKYQPGLLRRGHSTRERAYIVKPKAYRLLKLTGCTMAAIKTIRYLRLQKLRQVIKRHTSAWPAIQWETLPNK